MGDGDTAVETPMSRVPRALLALVPEEQQAQALGEPGFLALP
jgi:hypothetical protein